MENRTSSLKYLASVERSAIQPEGNVQHSSGMIR